MFAGEVGSIRLLRLFDKWGIKTTWFIDWIYREYDYAV